MKKVLVTGGNGQLGRALQKALPGADFVDLDKLDIADNVACQNWDWSKYDTVINAAAYTNVDGAETAEGRETAWAVNSAAVANLVAQANKHSLTLVHVSSDYVFDGSKKVHAEDESFSPLGVYGQTKAAGDIAASLAAKHYIVRTSWVVGDGKNFVRTMANLAEKGVKPSVVNDQIGRLTFTTDLADGIKFILERKAPQGTYNLSNQGDPAAWADIAKTIFKLVGHDEKEVTPISTEEYFRGKTGIAPRPQFSTLNLDKIKRLGFKPRNWQDALEEYLK